MSRVEIVEVLSVRDCTVVSYSTSSPSCFEPTVGREEQGVYRVCVATPAIDLKLTDIVMVQPRSRPPTGWQRTQGVERGDERSRDVVVRIADVDMQNWGAEVMPVDDDFDLMVLRAVADATDAEPVPFSRLDPRLSWHDIRRVAVKAGCDPRTVRARIARRPMRSLAIGEQIDAALRELGFEG